jgi:hypothetical protein
LTPVFTKLSDSSLFTLTLAVVFLSVKAVKHINFLGILYSFEHSLISVLLRLSNACLNLHRHYVSLYTVFIIFFIYLFDCVYVIYCSRSIRPKSHLTITNHWFIHLP